MNKRVIFLDLSSIFAKYCTAPSLTMTVVLLLEELNCGSGWHKHAKHEKVENIDNSRKLCIVMASKGALHMETFHRSFYHVGCITANKSPIVKQTTKILSTSPTHTCSNRIFQCTLLESSWQTERRYMCHLFYYQ